MSQDTVSESQTFKANGVTLTHDPEPWFVRLAWDPKVNYTNSYMTRPPIGARP